MCQQSSQAVLVRILKTAQKSLSLKPTPNTITTNTFGDCSSRSSIHLELGRETRVNLLLSALNICSKSGNLFKGRALHATAIETGDEYNAHIANSLVYMYTMCGSMLDARRVFERMTIRSRVSWNHLIKGYVDNGEPFMALELYEKMVLDVEVRPDARTFVAAVKACSSLASAEVGKLIEGKLVKLQSLEKGMAIHSHASYYGLDTESYVGCMLINMYSKCGRISDAHRVFDRITHRDKPSWNALLMACVDNGEPDLALEMFAAMVSSQEEPDAFTYVAALKACSAASSERLKSRLEKCRELHTRLVQLGYDLDLYVGSALVDAYVKCGSLEDAERTFSRMTNKDVVSWTALMHGYVEGKEEDKALELFRSMQSHGCVPDSPSLNAVFKACTGLAIKEDGIQVDGTLLLKLKSLESGMRVHSQALHSGLLKPSDCYTANSLIHMYAKCGSLLDARGVFDRMMSHDMVSWTSIVLGLAEAGEGDLALELFFHQRLPSQSVDAQTLAAALKACCVSTSSLDFASAIYEQACKWSLETDSRVVSSMVDVYSKGGCMSVSHHVFDSVRLQELATWNGLIAGYSRHGRSHHVFSLFQSMKDEGLVPDDITYVCLLTACSHAGLVDKARSCFRELATPNAEHYACMVDVLGRANQLEAAVAFLREAVHCGAMEEVGSTAAVAWRSVLASCVKWNNLEVARVAFSRLMEIDSEDVSVHSLMENIRAPLSQRFEGIKSPKPCEFQLAADVV